MGMYTLLQQPKTDLEDPFTTSSDDMEKVAFLVSGWSGPGIEWRFSPITSALEEAGYEVVLFKQCNNGWGDINHLAEKLHSEINDRWMSSVTVIGHSMGGLIASAADRLTNRRNSHMIDSIVTLGTPFDGTRVAKLAPWSESAQQMTPGSEFLYPFKWAVNNAQTMHIGGRRDFIVPLASAVGHAAADRTLVTNDTHLSLLFNKGVAEEIMDFLI